MIDRFQHSNTSWRHPTLIVLWFLRILGMIVAVVTYGLAMKIIRAGQARSSPIGVIIFFYMILLSVLLLDIVQFVLVLRSARRYLLFLIINAVQTTFWLGILVLDIVSAAERQSSAVAISFVAVLFLLYLTPTVHFALKYHEQRNFSRYGRYAPAQNLAQSDLTELEWADSPPKQ